jgi:predicted secreted protein
MALPGHGSSVYVSNSDAATTQLDGINNIDWGPAADLLETTDFMDTTAARTRILGLKDLSVTVSGDYEASDTGQSLLRTNWAAGTTTYVTFYPTAAVGFRCACIVESFSVTASFDGKVEFSCSLQGNGAISAAAP